MIEELFREYVANPSFRTYACLVEEVKKQNFLRARQGEQEVFYEGVGRLCPSTMVSLMQISEREAVAA